MCSPCAQKSFGKCCADFIVNGNSTFPFGYCEITCNNCPCASPCCTADLMVAKPGQPATISPR